ncbi:uncharacterized protein BP01DRAFT_354294 [Aspergillus saccharolyticus JOP 1030-1]|uniref:REJ domain-containing protein n=1 Tax=Aspergillus saccharolyticus JOP 1030-1 TaxID=1450539 RepID=A0A318ZM69_9EURO|nr:hypothetical protein BP01DRAFT_354294 [Aspergillus saccharolyticus JOP 1030-1]PYH47765.1 hypothetical protein BP01DRAFT_354294 [Aspergillus saccharolyticus JOP 1030-1]
MALSLLSLRLPQLSHSLPQAPPPTPPPLPSLPLSLKLSTTPTPHSFLISLPSLP